MATPFVTWIPWVMLTLGVVLVLSVPVIVWFAVVWPVVLLRDEWRETLPAGCGTALGLVIAALASAFGVVAIGVGWNLI